MSESDNGAIDDICDEDSVDNVVEKLSARNKSFGWEFLAYTMLVALLARNPLFKHEVEIKMSDFKVAALFHFVVVEILCKAYELRCMASFPGCHSEDARDIGAFVERIKNDSLKRISDIKTYCIQKEIPFPKYAEMYFKPTETEEGEEEDYGNDDDESEEESLTGEASLGFYSNDEEARNQGGEDGEDDEESVGSGSVSVDL
jgi:hypothetical protein